MRLLPWLQMMKESGGIRLEMLDEASLTRQPEEVGKALNLHLSSASPNLPYPNCQPTTFTCHLSTPHLPPPTCRCST